jgi:hypothetical protein
MDQHASTSGGPQVVDDADTSDALRADSSQLWQELARIRAGVEAASAHAETQTQELANLRHEVSSLRQLLDGFEGSAAPPTDYQRLRTPKKPFGVGHGPGSEQRIAEGLIALGVPVEELRVDVADYLRYRDQARYSADFPDYYTGNVPEKSLEHYVAAQLLDMQPGDVYIDVASEQSPVPAIYSRLFGVVAYRQDLAYPEGLVGDTIGGSATDMPVPPAFADTMALHCSFEHFEGLADSEFIPEAGRVLKPGGKCCMAPLYLAEDYGIQTDPVVAIRAGIEFESGVTLFAAESWGNRHGRFYDPEAFQNRVYSRRGNLSMTVYRIVNFHEVDPSCYARFALLITKPGS